MDLASFIAGPVAPTVMGDYGAEVIKIEPSGERQPRGRRPGMTPVPAATVAYIHGR